MSHSPGETFWYLGRQYRLKVEEGQPQGVKLRGRFLWVATAERDNPGRTMQLVDEWYRVRSHDVFERRLDCCMQIAERFGIKRPRMRRRRMVRRWGSCKVKGGILLNRDLVKAPVHCIDYVIMHELCHVRIPNHSRRFYDLLGQMMPDWELRKARLERAGR